MLRILFRSVGSSPACRPHCRLLALAACLLIGLPAPAQVIINELMYHPYEPWPPWQPAKTTNDSEYVELYNTGTTTVDLAAYRLEGGIGQEFPPGTMLAPGGFLVLCDNADAFTSYYPTVTNYLGNYAGRLANEGERITLSRFDGTNWVVADTIRYVDGGPSDGDGPSLELVHPGFARLRNQYYGDWAPSLTTNGTPGRTNSVYDPAPLPVVGDVLHTPALPPGNSAITITARATGRDGGALASVVLNYRVDALPQAAWSSTPMRDDGARPDALAGDGTYSVQLPEYGQPLFPDGTLLEFTITATDALGSRTFPATNRAGVLNGPYSYLCYFGEDAHSDCAYRGEYPTYQILMTRANRNTLQTRNPYSDVLLDGAFVTSAGEVFYNCGVRYRGGNSRNPSYFDRPYFPYRIEFPRGRTLDGFQDINFNQDQAQHQFIGMTVMTNAGYGCFASDAQLARLWLNETYLCAGGSRGANQGIYVRLEKFGTPGMERRYAGDIGNLYSADGDDFAGDLRYFGSLSTYYGEYIAETNNPFTVWHDLTNFCWTLAQDAAYYPQILTNRMHVRQWARHFATHVCLDNNEAGIASPYYTYGDELRLYGDPADGQFDIFPWDMSDLLYSANAKVWDYSHAVVSKFLYNPPVLPYYAGDALDVIDTVMSQTNMTALFDGMGSKASSYKATWLGRIAGKRSALHAVISTNLTVRVNGSPAAFPATLVPAVPVDVPRAVNDVSQDVNGWISLGSFDFAAATSESVRVFVDAEALTRPTVADAVMFSNAASTVIVDNSDALRFQRSGAWLLNSGGYGGSYYYSTNAGATATWTPLLTATGRYAVYAYSVTPAIGRIPPDPLADYVVTTREIRPTAAFSGTAPQAYTARVLVNGRETAWNLRTNIWSTAESLIFTNSVNLAVIQTLDSENRVLRSTNVTLVTYQNPQPKSGTIAANTTWDGRAGTVVVDGDVTVTGSATLTIASNTVVVFGAGRKITVAAGALDIRGSDAAPVHLVSSNGAAAWLIESAGGGSAVTGRHVIAGGGRFTASPGGRLVLQDAQVANLPGADPIIAATNASVWITRCVISNFSRTTFQGDTVVLEESLLDGMRQCGVELVQAGAGTAVRRVTVRRSDGVGVDGIRFLNSPAGLVTNCMIHNVSGAAVAAQSSSPTVCRSLAFDSAAGLAAAGPSAVTNYNNTFAGCLTGLVGQTAVNANLIIWSNAAAVSNGPAAMAYSDVELPGTNLYAGAANLNRNPWFRDTAEADYQLLGISPCRHRGSDGANLGAAFPAGANPEAPSGLTATNLTASQLELQWTDNSAAEAGYEIQQALAEGAWATVTNVPANTTNRVVGGLAENAEYRFRVRAFHSRGRSAFSDPAGTTTRQTQTTEDLIAYLRITEILYNQPGNDVAEFIEIKNVGGIALDLSGLYFDEGRFTFPGGTTLGPGNFFLLVQNTNGFKATYPGVPYQGVFQNAAGLANDGETIFIKDARGVDIFRVAYDDAPPWPVAPDTDGYTLVLLDEAAPGPYDAARWRASTYPGGSPGADDPPAAYGTVLINEVLTHQDTDNPGDWIELYNAGTSAVTIGNWCLSDSAANLTKFRIPAGATLTPGAHTSYTEYARFGTNVLGTNGFALSEFGETVYLSSATPASLTGYRTYVTFGAADLDVTFGRHVRSDGRADFTAMSAPTRGAANAYPKVGPLVINEIMYNPFQGGKEYVELYNPTPASVALHHPTNAWITWQLTNGIRYAFPPGQSMAAGEYALVVGIEPEEFRRMFGLTDPSLKVFGPFDGDLNNGGETVDLCKPGNPDAGIVPYVLVDRVEYGDDPPWPTAADNGGPSLERRAALQYGNDPTNWVAPTVGGTPGEANNVAGLPSLAFTVPGGAAYETNGTVAVSVSLLPAVAATVTVQYAASGGSAAPGSDYALSPGTLVFWPYDTVKSLPLVIKDDSAVEPDETVEITLSGLSANARLGGNRVFTHTIVDTDAASLPAPVILPAGTTAFTNSIQVVIVPGVSNSTVRYRLDGARPTAQDPPYLGPLTLTSSARVAARTFLGSYNEGDWSSALFLAQTGPDVPQGPYWEGWISASSDDAEEAGSRRVPALTNAVIGFGSADAFGAGFRFVNVQVPKAAIVTNAYVQFTAASDSPAGTGTLTIHAQAAGDAPTFVAIASNISLRPLTTNSVAWSPPPWSANDRGAAQRTPDLTGVIREVVSRPDWSTGNAVGIIVRYPPSPDPRWVRTFDGSPAQGALLRVEWRAAEHWLGVTTNGHGVVTGGNRWYAVNSTATLEAAADPYYRFGGWSGDTGAADTNLTAISLYMDRDRHLTARFPEKLVSCGAPEWWLALFYATNDWESVGTGDTDRDGLSGCDEYVAGTDPTRAGSVLKVTEVRPLSNALSVAWASVTGRVYSVFRSTDVRAGWPSQAQTSGVPGNADGTNVYADAPLTNARSFYRIGVSSP